MSNIMSNRNSTPEAGHSSLRPPGNRPLTLGMNQGRPASDAALLAQTANLPIRPSSDFYGQGHDLGHGNSASDSQERQEQEWLADIDQYESTLVEMAEATQDQDFKEELAAIEQWFLVLSEAERTAAMYALLQQTTRVQTRFFSQVLQQKEKSHPVPGILSPANFDKGTSALLSIRGPLQLGGAIRLGAVIALRKREMLTRCLLQIPCPAV